MVSRKEIDELTDAILRTEVFMTGPGISDRTEWHRTLSNKARELIERAAKEGIQE